MATAKSYENLPRLCEPFEENGRMYINVDFHGRTKKVRWYDEVPSTKPVKIEINQHDAFGFGGENDSITIFAGDNEEMEHYFREVKPLSARYNLFFFWFCPNDLPVPELPDSIKAVTLKWDDIKANDTRVKPVKETQKIVRNILRRA